MTNWIISKKPKIRAYTLLSIVLIMLVAVVCAFTNTVNKKTETEIGETQKNSQNHSDIETMNSDIVKDNDHTDENAELFQTESTHMEKCILKFNDTLYYGTDEIGPMGDAGCVAGYIGSSVAENETPTKNGESNFGCIGNPYTYDTDGGIMVFMDDEEWHWFYCLP